jgi:Signal peptidase, peptidase S26
VGGDHPLRRWPLRRFTVVEDSMRPALNPGDGLLAVRCGDPRRGQVRVFRDPTLPSRWLVKRVGSVRGAGRNATFEARSDNPRAPGVVDSRQFGWVPAAGSYRVVWTVRGRDG